LSKTDIKELAASLKFEKMAKGKNVVTYGEIGTKFYVIIKGVVGILIKNPAISDWKAKKIDYDNLKRWEKNVLSLKILDAKKATYDNYMANQSTTQVKDRAEKLKGASIDPDKLKNLIGSDIMGKIKEEDFY
jgi:hypothetical protein